METAVVERVIEQQYKELLREAVHILKQPFDAEDAVQTACMKAWSSCQHTAVNNCEAWLHVIVYHECIMILRNRLRCGLPFDTEMICVLRDTEELIEKYLSEQSLNDMIESLPLQYALLIKQHYYDGMGIREIADKLHQPTSTVRSRLFRARRMLHNRYNGSVKMYV